MAEDIRDLSTATSAVSSIHSLHPSVNGGVCANQFHPRVMGAQTRSLLETLELLSRQLQSAHALRREKSSLFTAAEKQMLDSSLAQSHDAIVKVATLVEGVRADVEVMGGKVRLRTRVLFAVRDAPKLRAILTQLCVVAQSLNRDLMILCNRQRDSGTTTTTATSAEPVVRSSLLQDGELRPPPPTYEEALFLTEGRERNVRRRRENSVSSGNGSSALEYYAPDKAAVSLVENATRRPETSVSSGSGSSAAEYYAPDKSAFSSLGAETLSSVEPQPATTEIVVELPADEGFGPLWDRAWLGESGCSPSSAPDELFFEYYAPTKAFGAEDEHPRTAPQKPVVSGRQRSLRWLEARASDDLPP